MLCHSHHVTMSLLPGQLWTCITDWAMSLEDSGICLVFSCNKVIRTVDNYWTFSPPSHETLGQSRTVGLTSFKLRSALLGLSIQYLPTKKPISQFDKGNYNSHGKERWQLQLYLWVWPQQLLTIIKVKIKMRLTLFCIWSTFWRLRGEVLITDTAVYRSIM